MAGTEAGRAQAKTARQRLLNILQDDFSQPRRIAQAIVEDAEDCLLGSGEEMQPGQMRVVLAASGESHAQPMKATRTKEVVWTVDSGGEDREVKRQQGQQALRWVRIQRLLSEAVTQGAVATQEDLARVLNVSVRTIKRDCAELQAAGIYLPTRGNLQGIGRGQTHKGQIVGRWLQGGTYDQISRQTHHSVASVGRYIQGFAQVMQLHRQDFPVEEIALLLHMGQALVQEYLAVYDENDSALARQRLDEQLERLRNRSRSEKKGAA
jgi:DNA-binding CsgD family transcriptional regulator